MLNVSERRLFGMAFIPVVQLQCQRCRADALLHESSFLPTFDQYQSSTFLHPGYNSNSHLLLSSPCITNSSHAPPGFSHSSVSSVSAYSNGSPNRYTLRPRPHTLAANPPRPRTLAQTQTQDTSSPHVRRPCRRLKATFAPPQPQTTSSSYVCTAHHRL